MDNRVEDLWIGKNARDLAPENDGEMFLYVFVDTKRWAKGHFPHASSAKLRESASTIVESTTHSRAVDVVLQAQGTIRALFVGNSR